ncbi:hypothetical protein PTTG_26830 [Puccinia triticina 1-1 BBBD Race 1]|uniref:Uncharacterized protein n=2 Tax=Puccinia triticina TaxID=208348 RepID=A0A180GRB8_PUCT1|nr:uncharacterized protein PtA15_14A57 [Puccinia triticina]OAV94968.1 hypothetical protein PTTG_26830 [Puccinia triticina 1-1 BBBD Race 1]WAQ91176.1 hypothetical protein PtA15_14A57 [Puccinia triticina]WAR61976.1 hypothetical protein PtB15_14B69 [Puccinia triticina]
MSSHLYALRSWEAKQLCNSRLNWLLMGHQWKAIILDGSYCGLVVISMKQSICKPMFFCLLSGNSRASGFTPTHSQVDNGPRTRNFIQLIGKNDPSYQSEGGADFGEHGHHPAFQRTNYHDPQPNLDAKPSSTPVFKDLAKWELSESAKDKQSVDSPASIDIEEVASSLSSRFRTGTSEGNASHHPMQKKQKSGYAPQFSGANFVSVWVSPKVVQSKNPNI